MRIAIALGGNALLRRSEPMTTEVQRRNIMVAAQAIAPLVLVTFRVHRPNPRAGLGRHAAGRAGAQHCLRRRVEAVRGGG
jgi:carbamate kinase